jgi:hypothetical protein
MSNPPEEGNVLRVVAANAAGAIVPMASDTAATPVNKRFHVFRFTMHAHLYIVFLENRIFIEIKK